MFWCGKLWIADNIRTNGNSGAVPCPIPAITGGTFHLVPSALKTDETLLVTIYVAFSLNLEGEIVLHSFRQVTATNVPETMVIPGGDSAGITKVGTCLPGFFRIAWTVGGTHPRMDFTLYASVVG